MKRIVRHLLVALLLLMSIPTLLLIVLCFGIFTLIARNDDDSDSDYMDFSRQEGP